MIHNKSTQHTAQMDVKKMPDCKQIKLPQKAVNSTATTRTLLNLKARMFMAEGGWSDRTINPENNENSHH
jgi:hypothetical protein